MKEGHRSKPYFHISVVSQMLDIHPQTVRNYERRDLVSPSRTDGNMRLFSQDDIERIKKIHTYTRMGVNLAGVEIIMKLLEQRECMEEEIDRLNNEVIKKLKMELEKIQREYKKDEE